MMKTFREVIRTLSLLGLLLLCGLPKSSAQATQILKAHPNIQSVLLWKLVEKHGKDSTRNYQLCDSVMAVSDKNGLLYAYAEFLKVDVQKFSRFSEVSERIAFLRGKQDYFLNSPHPVIRGFFCIKLSDALMRASETEEAFKFSFQARQIFEQVGFENIPMSTLFLEHFFFVSYYFEDYRTAIHFSELAVKYNGYNLFGNDHLLINRGEAYMRLGEYVHAKELFVRAMAEAKRLEGWLTYGISSGNMGNTLRLEGRYREALPYLYRDVAINEVDVPHHSAATFLSIAYCLTKLDSTAIAEPYLRRAERLVNSYDKRPQEWYWATYGSHLYQILYYEVKTLYERRTGAFDSALKYQDSLIVYKNFLGKVFDNRILMKAEIEKGAEENLLKIERTEQDKASAIQRRNLMLAVTALIALLSLYLLNHRRQREKQWAKALLGQAEEQLDQYVENLEYKNALIEKMSSQMASFKSHLAKANTVKAQIDALRRQVILTQEGWELFKENFEGVYPDFFDRVQRIHNGFTPAEVRLLALIKLNLDSKETAYLLGISMESLRKARYRLRKKVGKLPSNIHLSDLIGQE